MSKFQEELRAFSSAIERELETRELAFPTVLELSTRIRQAAYDPDISVQQIADLIRIEPVVSARVVQMANSVVFRPGGGALVTGVPSAIARVGLLNVRTIALVVAMDQLSEEKSSRPMRERAKLVWRHALDTGAWAYAFARQRRRDLADAALFAGLLTQMGELYLLARVGRYPAVADDLMAFAEISQFWSAAVTSTLLTKLDLPPEIVEAAVDTEGPHGVTAWPPASTVTAISLARLLAQPEIDFDARKRAERAASLERMRERDLEPSLDELIELVLPQREEILAVLRS
ncbi:MAG: HDOD domain-containing protein [Burkholderiales bacterium]